MPLLRIAVEVDGDQHTVEHLQGIRRRFEDPRPVLHGPVMTFMLERERVQFETGKGWRKQKPHKGRNPKVMIESGKLMAALSVRGAPGQKLTIGASGLTFGLERQGDVFYGKFLAKGAGHMPPRKPIPRLRKAEQDEVATLILDYVMHGD